MHDGQPKLADFGLAKITGLDPLHTFCGTVNYLAVEIFQRCDYTAAVDLWSLGVIIFELLAGYLPFYVHADTPQAQHKAIQTRILAVSYSFPEGFPSLAQEIVRALVTVPQARKDLAWVIGSKWLEPSRAQYFVADPDLCEFSVEELVQLQDGDWWVDRRTGSQLLEAEQ